MPSVVARLSRPIMKSVLAATLKAGDPADTQRRSFERVCALLPSARGTNSEGVNLEYCGALRIVPKKLQAALYAVEASGSHDKRALLYFHGGAYVVGSAGAYSSFLSHYAKKLNCLVLAVDYRLAPEHPHPAGLTDALSGWRYLLEQGYRPENIIIAGDSAGGGLSSSLVLKLKQEQQTLPGAVFLISPWVDLGLSGPSVTERADREAMIGFAWLQESAAFYMGGGDVDDPLLSPLFGEMEAWPPVLIHVGSDEILYDDSTRLAVQLQMAGNDVSIVDWAGMWHVFHILAPILPEANRAIDDSAKWMRSKLNYVA